ncbi:SDR family NAD(P)-dependent oxidoreductase [Paraflavitalea soli]|uniref:SDR family NAD(P)-dependent oxidoreductase n=1 Tax=Paraflavitalea soli TaxID=2315862 RepID=A0A3B7MQ31_9BACT|nr:oxidoreductase [Paraflavitalea soli]AXY76258.1 SDR family NAD(P)-dependent oxidoreductase [Paraflavitalea soli]
MKQSKVWFVTGASKGLGLSLVQQLLAQGYAVAATSRSKEDLKNAVGKHDQFLPLAVDINSEASIQKAIDETVVRFGQLDVVVNNAGYGLTGSLEELSDAEARKNFDINVFGTLNVIRKVMPYLRAQQSGHIFNISSIGGFIGTFPGFGIYCATKFAVEGLTEALATEIKSFGIHATVVAPGYFRTQFLSAGSLNVPEKPIEAYKEVRESQAFHQNIMDGNQLGDPDKAALAMIQIAETQNPPLHLFLGADAYDMAYNKINSIKEELEAWKSVTVSTAFEHQPVEA